ncbi:hypothetical protein ONE63_004030 [Megalurothrips usitatus]|uniref:Rap-GAP domain-containing protein n=1 Tax=Megalurothrips usitatus TaxID=439358 RepID=A0AAV7X7Z1_9NEOP|nr:hypothetical protein ONE63_004030 [Megalurothrips usitatus]
MPQIEADGSELNGRRFRVENGESLGEKEEMFGSPSTPVLENPEYQTRWYFKYFLGKLHQNYVALDGDKVPVFLSVVLTDANDQCVPQYRAILWRKTGAQKISVSYTPNKPMTVKQILSNFPNMEKLEKGPKEIFSPEIQKDLLLLEEQEGSVNFKFGVLYTKPQQVTDDEMFSNEEGSSDFQRFVKLLGDEVKLKGWKKYRGGLDVKGDMTGKHSVYTIYEGHEIMFHVSTMLPYSRDNRQQVERKRHIGNDIVNIVFLDGGPSQMCTFNPSFIKSQFTPSSPEARPFRLYRIPLHVLSGMVAPVDRRCPTPSPEPPASGCPSGCPSGSGSPATTAATTPNSNKGGLGVGLGGAGGVGGAAPGSSSSGSTLLVDPYRQLSRSCSSSPTPHQPSASFLASK